MVNCIFCFQNPNYGSGPGFSPNDISVVTISGSIEGSPVAGQIAADGTNPETNGWITGWGRLCGEMKCLPNL